MCSCYLVFSPDRYFNHLGQTEQWDIGFILVQVTFCIHQFFLLGQSLLLYSWVEWWPGASFWTKRKRCEKYFWQDTRCQESSFWQYEEQDVNLFVSLPPLPLFPPSPTSHSLFIPTWVKRNLYLWREKAWPKYFSKKNFTFKHFLSLHFWQNLQRGILYICAYCVFSHLLVRLSTWQTSLKAHENSCYCYYDCLQQQSCKKNILLN